MNHVEADAEGNIYPSAEATAFVAAVAHAIRLKLVAGKPSFGLMPYRHGVGYEFLGFDWEDEIGNTINFTFHISNEPYLPTSHVGRHNLDIGVRDITDALLLARLIAERVQGSSIGDI